MTDTFKNGGELVDLGTWYAGRDKIQHAIAGFVLAVACRRLKAGRILTVLIVLLLACLWEAFEEVRYRRWRTAVTLWYRRTSSVPPFSRGDSPPRPRFCDEFSWRDIVATLAGALVALP